MSENTEPLFDCDALGCDRPAGYAFIYGERVELALCERHGGTDSDIPGWLLIPRRDTADGN
jgi:hypothetical protein